jgi:TolB protein
MSLVVAPVAAHATFPGGNGDIVYQHTTESGVEQADVFTIRPDGTGRRQLTHTPNRNEFGPAWDPAGSRIAFWRTKAPFGPGSIWVMDGHGSNQRRLTTGIDARDPAWSPSGRRIVFTSDGDLFTIRVSDGGTKRRLTSSRALDFEPAWSVDRRIVFTRGFEQGDVGDLYVVNVGTHKVTRLTSSPDYDHQASTSPDGERVVFERDFDDVNGSSVVVVHADGSDLRRLTAKRSGFFDTGPAFSPSGRRIAFGRDRPSFFADLFVMHANGQDQHRIRRESFFSSFPDWQPL